MARAKRTNKTNKKVRSSVPAASYAWYYSSSRVRSMPAPAKTRIEAGRSTHSGLKLKLKLTGLLVLLIAVLAVAWPAVRPFRAEVMGRTTAPAVAAQVNRCTGNTLSRFILVSISRRHLWACDDSTAVYDSPVVTGMAHFAADRTPTGTYHIYAKETNLHLTGSDSTGSWNDYVYYWMPWLSNQYGQYGFHDATWRPAGAFGNISPDSSNASHGCVELPLATAKWLYGWAQIGTTVTIQN